MSTINQTFTKTVGIQHPLICGPMYPCSNPELVAAASEAGAIGIVQPIALTYVHGYEFRQGLQHINQLTNKPIGFNALIEGSSKRYRKRMEEWIDIALEEGIRFFITSLGKPDWVARKVHAQGGLVYHDVTELRWARKGEESGVDGLICVNNRAGGHTGTQAAATLFDELQGIDLPKICAGGIATAKEYQQALNMGYAGVQMGTAFIATEECSASTAYKLAIVDAGEADIVLTERLTGVPVSILRPEGELGEMQESRLPRWLLHHPKAKHWIRLFYSLKALHRLKTTLHHETQGKVKASDCWQAGKSVAGINECRTVATLVKAITQGAQ